MREFIEKEDVIERLKEAAALKKENTRLKEEVQRLRKTILGL